MKLLIATTNRGKLLELSGLLSEVPGLTVLTPADVGPLPPVIEDGLTFEDNAAIKARAYRKAAGCAVLADDSGLEVDGLGGRPGVHSARYAGEGASDQDNLTLLLSELAGVDGPARAARYRAVLIVALQDGTELVSRGACEGQIIAAPRGEGGFGYDPVFVPLGYGRTMAELPAAEKNQISHRGRACQTMVEQLTAYLAR